MTPIIAKRRQPGQPHRCELCENRSPRPASLSLSVIGRHLLVVCRPCRKEAERIWEGAL